MPRFQSPISTVSQSSGWTNRPWYSSGPLWRKMSISRAFARPGRRAPNWIPQRGPYKVWCPFTEPSSPYPAGYPERRPSNRAPTKRDVPFPEPSNYLLKFPVNGLPRFPKVPLRRETSVSVAFFYTSPLNSPVNEPPSMFPTGSLWRKKLRLQSQSPQ